MIQSGYTLFISKKMSFQAKAILMVSMNYFIRYLCSLSDGHLAYGYPSIDIICPLFTWMVILKDILVVNQLRTMDEHDY